MIRQHFFLLLFCWLRLPWRLPTFQQGGQCGWIQWWHCGMSNDGRAAEPLATNGLRTASIYLNLSGAEIVPF